VAVISFTDNFQEFFSLFTNLCLLLTEILGCYEDRGWDGKLSGWTSRKKAIIIAGLGACPVAVFSLRFLLPVR